MNSRTRRWRHELARAMIDASVTFLPFILRNTRFGHRCAIDIRPYASEVRKTWTMSERFSLSTRLRRSGFEKTLTKALSMGKKIRFKEVLPVKRYGCEKYLGRDLFNVGEVECVE